MLSIYDNYLLLWFLSDRLIRTWGTKTWWHGLSDRSHILQTRWTIADGACNMASVCCGCCKNSFWCRRQILNWQLIYFILSYLCSTWFSAMFVSVILPLSLIYKNLVIVQYQLLAYIEQFRLIENLAKLHQLLISWK